MAASLSATRRVTRAASLLLSVFVEQARVGVTFAGDLDQCSRAHSDVAQHRLIAVLSHVLPPVV